MAYNTYWVGGDGNAWTRQGDSVTNQGKFLKDYDGSGFDSERYSAASDGDLVWQRIDDPNPPSGGNMLGDYTYGSGDSGAGSGSTSEDLNYLNSQQSLYERLMDSIGTASSEGLNDINNNYISATNKANTQYARASEDFGVQRSDSERGQTQALNRVGDNSRTLRNSLMRMLGLGASGGSAFMVADNAVARDASKNRAGVQENFGVNFRNLGTAEKRAEEDYNSLLGELSTEKGRKAESFRAGIIGQQQSIQGVLDEIAAEKQKLQGGSGLDKNLGYYNFDLYQDRLDALPGQYNTDVQAKDLKIEIPQLKDYIVDRATINGGQGQQTRYSPYAEFLKKSRDEEEQLA